MIGAIADDTVMTVATAAVLLGDASYVDAYRQLGRQYPHTGYGGGFRRFQSAFGT